MSRKDYQIHVRIDYQDLELLNRICAETQETLSQVVRTIIHEKVNRYDQEHLLEVIKELVNQ